MEAAEQQGNLSGAGVAGSALGQFSNPVSVPRWADSTPEQRMEMMREEVRYLRRMVTDLQRTVRKLQNHQHALDGSIVVPMRDRDEEDRPRNYFYDPLK